MRLNLLDICRLTGSVCVGMAPAAALSSPSGAAIDSRAVKKGDLFFCLPGERVDGHDFAAVAAEKGALAIIGSRNPFGDGASPVPLIVVDDVAEALGQIALAHRRTTNAVVVGVTGTSGKTSVKEVLYGVLSEHGETAKNPVNLNNQIGLPLSMCNASEDAAYWVMEAGISRPRDMDELGEILQPDVALILNAGAGHVQELGVKKHAGEGSEESTGSGVAHYKARLLAHLAKNAYGPESFAVVSADYPDLVREAASHGRKVLWFSAEDTAQPYHAEYLGPDSAGGGKYSLTLKGKEHIVTAPFHGGYGAENVAAIGAVAHALGLNEKEIAEGFTKAALPDQRFALRRTGDFLVIDDSYNANPLSMGRMLDAAADMAKREKSELVLVLGEMGELGPESPEFHRELGMRAAKLHPKSIYWKGEQGEGVAKGLRDGGFRGAFAPVTDADDFMTTFACSGVEKAVVLFKGSRSNKLEELVAAFMDGTEPAGKGKAPGKGKTDAV